MTSIAPEDGIVESNPPSVRIYFRALAHEARVWVRWFRLLFRWVRVVVVGRFDY